MEVIEDGPRYVGWKAVEALIKGDMIEYPGDDYAYGVVDSVENEGYECICVYFQEHNPYAWREGTRIEVVDRWDND